LILFCVLLPDLPALLEPHTERPLKVFEAFYRLGAFVFGDGHVVLPLLQQQTIATGGTAT
jgi:chromate transporter